MRRQVYAALVLRHQGDHLVDTLVGVASQTHDIAQIVVVDLTGVDDTEDVVTEHLRDTSPIVYLRNKHTTGWSDAINQARQALADGAGHPVDQGWLWLLRDDTQAEPSALQHLIVAVDGAPSVVMAGGKQRNSNDRAVLREFGETITRYGQRQAVVDRELDQAQYDRMSDVLSVGDAGALIRLDVFDALGGFDPGLDPLDAPLDMGVRARLAGHRVLAVPRAILYVGSGPADWRAGKKLSSFTLYRLDRAAWLYRRFVWASWWAVIPLLLTALPLSLVRATYFFAAKHPDTAVADILATGQALLALPRIIAARVRLHTSKMVGWASIRPLRMSPTDRKRRRDMVAEERFAALEDTARLTSRPAFWPGGLWMVLGLIVAGVILSGPLLSARALSGGGLLPLSPTLDGLWAGTRWLVPDLTGGMWGETLLPADPASLLFSLLGSLTWWEPSQAIVWFWPAVLPLAGVIAWWAGSQLLSRSLATTVMAIAWALSPSLLVALAEGRLPAVIVHLALPWLLATALTAHDSWQRAAQAGFATAVVVAAAPILWPAVIIGWAVVLVATGWRTPLRTLVGTAPLALAPALVMWGPRFLAPSEVPLLEGFGRWFADPGVAYGFDGASWWFALLGWPTEPATTVWGGAIPGISEAAAMLTVPIVLAAIAVVVTNRAEGIGAFTTLVPLGLMTALAAPEITQGFNDGRLVGLWPGSAVSLLWLGVVIAAATTLDVVQPGASIPGTPTRARQLATWTIALLGVAGVALSGLGEASRHWLGESPVTALAESRVVPALVAADAPQHPRQGILAITSTGVDDPLTVTLLRGSGPRLDDISTLYRQRTVEGGADNDALAALTASLVEETSDDPGPLLTELGIRFIWFQGDPSSDRALAISRSALLLPASEADDQALWQVADATASTSAAPMRQPDQLQWDLWWWIVAALWGVLALPTERRPRHQSADTRDDERLSTVLEEPDDEQ